MAEFYGCLCMKIDEAFTTIKKILRSRLPIDYSRLRLIVCLNWWRPVAYPTLTFEWVQWLLCPPAEVCCPAAHVLRGLLLIRGLLLSPFFDLRQCIFWLLFLLGAILRFHRSHLVLPALSVSRGQKSQVKMSTSVVKFKCLKPIQEHTTPWKVLYNTHAYSQ